MPIEPRRREAVDGKDVTGNTLEDVSSEQAEHQPAGADAPHTDGAGAEIWLATSIPGLALAGRLPCRPSGKPAH